MVVAAAAEGLVARDEDSMVGVVVVEEVASLHEEDSIAAAIVVEHEALDSTPTEGKSSTRSFLSNHLAGFPCEIFEDCPGELLWLM